MRSGVGIKPILILRRPERAVSKDGPRTPKDVISLVGSGKGCCGLSIFAGYQVLESDH
jgi:hypothetical protein